MSNRVHGAIGAMLLAFSSALGCGDEPESTQTSTETSEELIACIEGLLDAECLPGPIMCP